MHKRKISESFLWSVVLIIGLLSAPAIYSQFNEEHDDGGSGTCGTDPGGSYCYRCVTTVVGGVVQDIDCGTTSGRGRSDCTIHYSGSGTVTCETSGAFCDSITVTP